MSEAERRKSIEKEAGYVGREGSNILGWGRSKDRRGWGPRPVGLALDFKGRMEVGPRRMRLQAVLQSRWGLCLYSRVEKVENPC